eukprot:Rhum_TRINITY_DN14159_c15_g2::Rhum_TRINITY_DN14159_c15_g2_i1::g.71231::m.71231
MVGWYNDEKGRTRLLTHGGRSSSDGDGGRGEVTGVFVYRSVVFRARSWACVCVCVSAAPVRFFSHRTGGRSNPPRARCVHCKGRTGNPNTRRPAVADKRHPVEVQLLHRLRQGRQLVEAALLHLLLHLLLRLLGRQAHQVGDRQHLRLRLNQLRQARGRRRRRGLRLRRPQRRRLVPLRRHQVRQRRRRHRGGKREQLDVRVTGDVARGVRLVLLLDTVQRRHGAQRAARGLLLVIVLVGGAPQHLQHHRLPHARAGARRRRRVLLRRRRRRLAGRSAEVDAGDDRVAQRGAVRHRGRRTGRRRAEEELELRADVRQAAEGGGGVAVARRAVDQGRRRGGAAGRLVVRHKGRHAARGGADGRVSLLRRRCARHQVRHRRDCVRRRGVRKDDSHRVDASRRKAPCNTTRGK